MLGGACAHAKTTDQGTEKQQAKEQEEKPKRARTEAKSPAGDGKGSELHPGNSDAVPVATAPDVLLTPGGEDKIRERLASEGYLDSDDEESKGTTRAAASGASRRPTICRRPASRPRDGEEARSESGPDFRQGTVKD